MTKLYSDKTPKCFDECDDNCNQTCPLVVDNEKMDVSDAVIRLILFTTILKKGICVVS